MTEAKAEANIRFWVLLISGFDSFKTKMKFMHKLLKEINDAIFFFGLFGRLGGLGAA